MKIKYKNILYISVFLSLLVNSCAVQQPPSGGDDDKTPPKILNFTPANNTLNFRGRTVEIEFDEYVDRRSFSDALVITPKPKGELIFDWSGKSVEISVKGGFEPNRTYLITIGKGFKDLRGGNQLTQPFSFAFATGSKIDKCKISGKVYDFNRAAKNDNTFRDVVITSYIVSGGKSINPVTDDPDFVLPVSDDGSFLFQSLPEAEYLVFALLDADRNYKYDTTYEFISMPDRIINVVEGETPEVMNYLMDINATYITRNIYGVFEPGKISYGGNNSGFDYVLKKLNSDSAGYVYSSLTGEEKNISYLTHFIFYFKNNIIPRFDILSSFSLRTRETEIKSYLNFHSISDSLIDVTSQNPLLPAQTYVLDININTAGIKYSREIEFKTPPEREFGSLKIVLTGAEEKKYTVYLINKTTELIFTRQDLEKEFKYNFNNVIAGEYILFAYEDSNGNGYYDFGGYFPFEPAEKFYFHPEDVVIKGGWTIENFGVTF
jgi:hypothetical protein